MAIVTYERLQEEPPSVEELNQLWRTVVLRAAETAKEDLPPHLGDRLTKATEFVLAGHVSILDGVPTVTNRKRVYRIVERECKCTDAQQTTMYCKHVLAGRLYTDAMSLFMEARQGEMHALAHAHDGSRDTPSLMAHDAPGSGDGAQVAPAHAQTDGRHDAAAAVITGEEAMARIEVLEQQIRDLQRAMREQLPEAPVSVNIKQGSNGRETMITLRGKELPPILALSQMGLGWLDTLQSEKTDEEAHEQPASDSQRSGAQERQGRHGGNGRDAQRATGTGDTRVCALHHTPMRRYERGDQVWYSHKLASGTWCRGE